ncbi:MAG TPA: paraquat-inducible protein A [Tepidisphaeraceae bacterium]|jgi:paraquat-inducible protein A
MIWPIRLLTLLAAALLGLGLIAPCMTIQPAFGEFENWVRLLSPDSTRPSTYSILTGILAMMHGGNRGIGILLLAFSCFFPTLKLALMAWSTQKLADRRRAGIWLTLVHHAGKFSMLDVLVLAMLVVAIKGLPGGSQITLGWGVWAFASSVVLSLIISMLLHTLERKVQPEPVPQP